MVICPACQNNKLVRVGDTYQCKDTECGCIKQTKIAKSEKQLLKIVDNEKVY